MTKYILAGGYLHNASDGGRAFCEELIKNINKKPVKILDCMFARFLNSWEIKFKEDGEFFSKYINNFELILASQENFLEQVKSADIVFLRGGETELLLERLNKTGNWVKELEGKTLVGTSAGGDVISKYSWNLDLKKVEECLGLLPIKFIPHWHSDYDSPNIDWQKAFQELKEYKEDLPIYALKEGEFKVFEK